MIVGGFSTSREHKYADLYNICERCGATRRDIMDGRADWECKAADNVVAIDAMRKRLI